MIGLPEGRSCGRSFLTFWPEIRDATASSMKKMECYVRLVEVAAMQL